MEELREMLLELCNIQDTITHLNEGLADLNRIAREKVRRKQQIEKIVAWVRGEQ
jgi:hypothetical protein